MTNSDAILLMLAEMRAQIGDLQSRLASVMQENAVMRGKLDAAGKEVVEK